MKKHYQRLTQLARELKISKKEAWEYVKNGVFVRHTTKNGNVYYDYEECKENLEMQREVGRAIKKVFIEDENALTINDCRQIFNQLNNKEKQRLAQQEASLRLEEMQKEIQELNSIIHRYYLNAEKIKKALLKYIEEEQESKTSIIETIGFFILGATLVIIAGLICIHNL